LESLTLANRSKEAKPFAKMIENIVKEKAFYFSY